MKIKFVAEDDLNTIKSNLNQIYKKVIKNKECSVAELLGKDYLIKESNLEIESFNLDVSQPKENASLTDSENVKRVYTHMKFMSDSQASDERIWAAYCLSDCLDYMMYRWPANNATDLNNRYLFGYSSQRSLFRNGMSRLWWIGRCTYDTTREDPFELTSFLCKNQDYIESICGRNIFNNANIGLGVVSALYDAEKSGAEINRETVRDIAKYTNLLAGTYMLDLMDRNEIYTKIKDKIGF